MTYTTTPPDSIRPLAALLAAGLVAVAACTEDIPSGPDDSQLPTAPVTVSLTLPWDEFASNLQVFGGYGLVDDMSTSIVANAYNGVQARTLLKFGTYPRSAEVRDSLTRELRTDTLLNFVDSYIVIQLDTMASTNTGMVQLAFGQMQQRWDSRTANWSNAVDSIGGVVPWSQPGGGTVTPVSMWDWDPTVTDSAQLFLDSTRIREWRTGPDSVRSARIDLVTTGHRLKIVNAALRVVAQSSINRDTVLVFTVSTTDATFVYDPPATPPADGIRVGGAPAWRTVLDISVPTTLNGPPTLCAVVGCPFTLGPEHVTYAGLGLRSRSLPGAFNPTDTVSMQVRPVLDRGTLPKAPLGAALGRPEGTPVAPELFGAQEGTLVDLPITRYVQLFLAGPDPSGRPPPTTLSILAATEPETFTFGSFFGPGPTNAPVLNLVLTVSQPMEIQ
jgi:hypothetical protein